MYKNSKKVKDLEKEVQELRLMVTNLEEKLKNTETFINNFKNNTNPESVITTEVPTEATPEVTTEVTTGVPEDITKKDPTEITTNIPEEVPSGNNDNKSEVSITVLTNENPDNENNITENQNTQIDKIKKLSENSLTESWVGKILMGALASLLVFIALITFAKILLPYLTDTMKIIFMFIASFALTAIGYVLNRRKPKNTFYKSLLACGSACIYLSILVTGVYFKAIKSIVMYLLIGIWAVFIIFLKKDINDWLFFVIGNIGYFVSIIFSASIKDKSLIIPLLIYVIMICVIYQIMYWKNKYQRLTQNVVNIISLLLFHVIMIGVFEKITEVKIIGIVSMAFTFIGFIAFSIVDLISYRKEHFFFVIANAIAYLLSYLLLSMNWVIKYKNIVTFIVIIIPAIILECILMYWRSKNLALNESYVNGIFTGLLFYFAAMVLAVDKNFFFHSGIIIVVYSLIVVYGIIKKDSFIKTQGWVLFLVCVISGLKYMSAISVSTAYDMSFIIITTILVLISLIVEAIVLNDSEIFKIVNYLFLLGCILRIVYLVDDRELISVDSIIITIVTFVIISLLNFVMIITKFYNTKNIPESNHIHIILDSINVILILFGIIMMNESDTRLFKILYMVSAFALSCINLPIKDKGSSGRYLYTAIKFTFLIYYSLWIFRTPNIVMSICMIAVAVVCISVGFKNNLIGKDVRIFGLMMTLIFVIKLIIVDIKYDSSVLKALSYLISGMLCFGISAIYNYFDKKQKRNP